MSDSQNKSEQSLDQMYVQQWLEEYGFNLEKPEHEVMDGQEEVQQSYRFGAVSSDFTVQLGMRVTMVSDGRWYVAIWLEQMEDN